MKKLIMAIAIASLAITGACGDDDDGGSGASTESACNDYYTAAGTCSTEYMTMLDDTYVAPEADPAATNPCDGMTDFETTTTYYQCLAAGYNDNDCNKKVYRT